jgi:spore coat protein CotH
MVDPFWEGQISAFDSVLKILNTLETKEVDLEEVARHYLLHEHISPLNEVLHQADLKVEMQYHKDIEDAYKAGFEVGLKMKGE